MKRVDRKRDLLGLLLAAANEMLPKDRSCVVLHSVPDLEDSIVALLDELLARNYRPVLLLDDPRVASLVARRWENRVKGVPKRSKEGLRTYLRAGVVFTTHGIFANHRVPDGQTLVNIWHGEPPGKPVGQFDGDPPTPASLATVCSNLGRVYRSAEFGLPPTRIKITGAARNDRMLKADRTDIRSSLDLPSSPLWVWLPTYRASVRGPKRTDGSNGFGGLPFEKPDLLALDNFLEEQGITLLVKPHPLSDQTLLTAKFRRLCVMTDEALRSAGVSLYQLLGASDGLVTDLSSVWIDYLLLDRPIIFAFPDLELYRKTRGINAEPFEAWIPGPLVTTLNDFLNALSPTTEQSSAYVQERRVFAQRLHAFFDSGSSARIVEAAGLARL